jgi:hypothetical protein
MHTVRLGWKLWSRRYSFLSYAVFAAAIPLNHTASVLGRPLGLLLEMGALIVIVVRLVLRLWPNHYGRRRWSGTIIEESELVWATKVAKVGRPLRYRADDLKYYIRPLFGEPYTIEDAAICAYISSEGTIPHDLGRRHRCGFYAYSKPILTIPYLLRYPSTVILDVVLYGEIIYGAKGVLRSQYQRVMRVRFFDLCAVCTTVIPRPAVVLTYDTMGSLHQVCHMHRMSFGMSLQKLSNSLGTEVVWQRTWLSRWARRVHAE